MTFYGGGKAAEMEDKLIRVDRVSKIFRSGSVEVRALDGLSLEVKPGQSVLVRGPSGSGKTTLLNIVGCLTRVTSGKVFIGEREVTHLPDHFLGEIRRHEIGFIFQAYNLLAGYSVVHNVAIPLVPQGVSEKGIRRRVLPILEKLGLQDRAWFKVNELSGGEQQRVAIARALVNEPSIILADEPVSNVDQYTAKKIYEIISSLREEKRTLIISSHNPFWERSGMIDHIYNFAAGRLHQEGK